MRERQMLLIMLLRRRQITPASADVKRGAFFANSKNRDAFYGQLEAIVSTF